MDLTKPYGGYGRIHCSFPKASLRPIGTHWSKHTFLNASTDRNYLNTLFKKNKSELVVMEVCGPSGWINDLAKSLKLKTLVCSTNEDACRVDQLIGV